MPNLHQYVQSTKEQPNGQLSGEFCALPGDGAYVLDEVAEGQRNVRVGKYLGPYKSSDRKEEYGDIQEKENIKIDSPYLEEPGSHGDGVGLGLAEDQIKGALHSRHDDGDLCPVGVAYVIEAVLCIIASGHLAGIIIPILMDVVETGELTIGANPMGVESGIQHHPSVMRFYFHDIMGCPDAACLHLSDANGVVIRLKYHGHDLGIAAAGALGSHQVDRCAMKEIRAGTEEAGAFEYGSPVAHQVMAGSHGFYENRVLCIIAVQAIVDAAFDGSEKPVLIGGFHFEIK